MASIFEDWKAYRQRVMPATCPDIQAVECKRAFYAGAFSLFTLLQRIVSDDAETTDADMDAMQKVDDEFKDFYKRMLEGKE